MLRQQCRRFHGSRASRSSLNQFHFSNEQSTRPILPDPKFTTVTQSKGCIDVTINDSIISLPIRWLRDSCRCIRCINPSTSQKSFNTGSLTDTAVLTRIIGNNLECIFPDSHRSLFSTSEILPFLTRESASLARHNDHVPLLWDSTINVDALRTRYNEYLRDQSNVIKALTDHGLAFIDSCPIDEKTIEGIVTKIAPIKNTFYGQTWDVRSIEDAKNVAYTSDDLDLHMDLLYYDQPPGLQFLHCLENKVSGGSSIFVDAFKVAEEIRHESPEAFKVLCDYFVDYAYHNDGQWYHQSRPSIVLKEGKIEYVNYSPPFQGTLVAEGFREYSDAIALFASKLADPSNRLELTLQEGQCVIFNNRRTLHARRSFGAGARWLKGAYCDIDGLWSRYRIMRHS